MWIEGSGDTISVEEFPHHVCRVVDGFSWHDWECFEGSDIHWELAHHGRVPVSFPKPKANLLHKLLAVFLLYHKLKWDQWANFGWFKQIL